ncbi:MAG TPA: glycogen synthase [Bacillota bacterium]|nr:glycogen synthase [Bacillota bacterium]HPZ13089.1 glycogen synthase [Bacillota bacterium]
MKSVNSLGVTMMTREFPPNIYGGAGVHVDYLSTHLADLMNVEVRCFGEGAQTEDAIRIRSYSPWLEMSKGSDPKLQKVLDPLSVDLAMVKDPIETEIVHCHTWYTFFAGYLAKTMYGSKLVTTVHSLEPLRPWKEEQLGRGYSVSSWMERIGIENSDCVIAVSKEMRQDVIEHYDVEPEKVVVIHNGIDLSGYRRTDDTSALEQYGIEEPYVLFVGRISRQKGIMYLLDAAPMIRPGVKVVLIAGTPDTKEIEEELAARVKDLPNVVWINRMLPREHVIQLYSHASVFACPSVYEPFGIINLEAMACEIPVVASAVGGIPEVVVDGETGFLVPPGDPESLASAINRVIDSEKLHTQFGKAGRRRVERFFSWEAIAEKTKDMYLEILSE